MQFYYPLLVLCTFFVRDGLTNHQSRNYHHRAVNGPINVTASLGIINIGIQLTLIPEDLVNTSVDTFSRYPYNENQAYRYSPLTQTEYKLKTVQTGTAYIPPGSRNPIHIGPDHNQTRTYLLRTDTTVHHMPVRSHRRQAHPYRGIRRRGHQTRSADCIKCPAETILIARRGVDGVLVNAPKLRSCQNRAIFNKHYRMETLFGEQFKFLLPHGTHSFLGRIFNKRTGKFEQTCVLRYKVVVQQCGKYYPEDPNIKVKCDLGTIWGSKCHFTCREGFLSHNKPMVCGDSLNWEGEEPECLTQSTADETKGCDLLMVPDNGRFSCQYPKGLQNDDFDNDLTSPNGSICRVKCNANFEVPKHLELHNVVLCENGRWNTTVREFCQPKAARWISPISN